MFIKTGAVTKMYSHLRVWAKADPFDERHLRVKYLRSIHQTIYFRLYAPAYVFFFFWSLLCACVCVGGDGDKNLPYVSIIFLQIDLTFTMERAKAHELCTSEKFVYLLFLAYDVRRRLMAAYDK